MVAVIGIMIPIVALVGAFILVIYLRKYQHDERLVMIEKGVGAELFESMRPRSASGALRAALLLIGAGLGLLMGHILERNLNMEEEVAYFSMVLIFGGLGLGAAYLVEEKKIKEERSRQYVNPSGSFKEERIA